MTTEVASNPTGTAHTLIAAVTNPGAAACVDASGWEIDFEVESGPAVTFSPTSTSTSTGANNDGNTPATPDATCTATTADPPEADVDANECSITFSSAAQGTNVVRGWVDDDKDNATVDLDTLEGPNGGGAADVGATGTAVPGNRTEVDDTDVVLKTWTQGFVNACIDAEPDFDVNPSGTNHEITARATNASVYTPSDQDDVFNCGGTALAGATVEVTITDDTPNAYIVSVNGVATGGPLAGGPNTVDATADANGQVVVVISCVSGTPGNCTGENEIEFFIPGVTGANEDTDYAYKEWAPAGTPASFDASPEADTNEVGQQHTMTCESTDAFGNGVAGQNCDFNITAGANATVNVDGNALTPVGYAGQCTTGAAGTCSVSYTSAVATTDTINVFHDLNNNDVNDDVDDDDIVKTWVAAGAGVSQVAIDMEGCNGAGAPTDASWDAAGTDPVNTPTNICAQAFNAANAPLTAPVTFTITGGPGHFTNAGGTANLGTSVTVEDTGYASTYIISTESGVTTVTATSHGATDTGTQTWTVPAGSARNIAVSAPATAFPGESASASALVTDVFDNPVPGVTVTFTETGPAVITSANPTVTDANGVAEIIYTSTDEGVSTITASISAGATDCELAAGTPPGSAAGNCSDSTETEWTTDVPDPDEHARTLTLDKVRHVRDGGKRKLFLRGGLTVDDGFEPCSEGEEVKLQRKVAGSWFTQKTDTTGSGGNAKFLVRDRSGKYRLRANESTDGTDTCGKATSNVRRHRHGGGGGGGAKFVR